MKQKPNFILKHFDFLKFLGYNKTIVLNGVNNMVYTFISGATGGLGKAFVYENAKEGKNLFLTGRNTEALKKLKEDVLLKYSNVKIEYFACQLNNEIERNNLYDYINNLNITFDRLCNVAGVDIQKAFEKYTESKIITQVRVNIESTLCLTHYILEKRADNLEIITISSMSAMSPMPYFAIYSSTKLALISFFKSLKYELKGQNIKITVVAPGGIPTRQDIIDDIKGQGIWGELSSKTPEYVAIKSIKAVKKNKTIFIPGFFNRFLNCLMKLVPNKIKMNFIAKRWKKLEKDAF